MSKLIDLTGSRFGKIVVMSRSKNNSFGQSRFMCKCDCGVEKEIAGRSLMSGKQISCGCHGLSVIKKASVTHGFSKTRLYFVWKEMRARCERPTHKRYKDYGGRGIKVCKRWTENFMNFIEDMSPRPSGLTLDRKNNNGNYTPSNCKWSTYREQNNNKKR